jgi:hypothetical protein
MQIHTFYNIFEYTVHVNVTTKLTYYFSMLYNLGKQALARGGPWPTEC